VRCGGVEIAAGRACVDEAVAQPPDAANFVLVPVMFFSD